MSETPISDRLNDYIRPLFSMLLDHARDAHVEPPK
jgi:hypothetical protein